MDVAARPVPLTGSDQQAYTGPCTYRGLTVRETASGTAVVRIHDGDDNTGTVLATVALAADESHSEWLGAGGIRADGGLFVDIVSGAVEGSVRIG